MADFSKTLRELMDAGDYTQQQVAAALNVSHRAVGGWLAGAKPRAGKLKKLAEFFDVTLEVLEGKEPLTSKTALPDGHDSKEAYQRMQSLPAGDASALADFVGSFPEGVFKDRLMEGVYNGVMDAIFGAVEEQIELSAELTKALVMKGYDDSHLPARIRDYRIRQRNAAALALEYNARAGANLPIPKDMDEIKETVAHRIDLLIQDSNKEDQTA